MGFTKIILVGFDCSGSHSYKKLIKNDVCDWNENNKFKGLIDSWIKMKNFIDSKHKNIDIKIINPIGLKNIFIEYIYE